MLSQLPSSVLHNFPKKEVHRPPIDSCCLYVEDTYTFEGGITGYLQWRRPAPRIHEISKCEGHVKEMMPPRWGGGGEQTMHSASD